MNMSFRNFIAIRRLATSNSLRKSILSSDYRSGELWQGRFQCPIICNNETIRVINNKILAGNPLSNLELDIFINVARPTADDKAQLQEASRLLADFRKSLHAHRLLPSTPHAVCRLFLDSHNLPSLITLLDNRVKYGVFPDFFSTNLLLDAAINLENFALASKIASLVMLQEEFGLNYITDRLSLLALAQYTDSGTDFGDWPSCDSALDPVLSPNTNQTETINEGQTSEKAKPGEQDDEEEEEDEYIRVPFLRNPYFDNHFDVTNPRVICGKSLSALGWSLCRSKSLELGCRSELLGSVLQGRWDEVAELAGKCNQLKLGMGATKNLLNHLIENVHGLEAPSDGQKDKLKKSLNILSSDGPSLVELAKRECETIGEKELEDISELKSNLQLWSKLREQEKQAEIMRTRRRELAAEIKAKKEELQRQEEYLYFFDRLKRSRLTRIDYD